VKSKAHRQFSSIFSQCFPQHFDNLSELFLAFVGELGNAADDKTSERDMNLICLEEISNEFYSHLRHSDGVVFLRIRQSGHSDITITNGFNFEHRPLLRDAIESVVNSL
jgi:hypothetical protein